VYVAGAGDAQIQCACPLQTGLQQGQTAPHSPLHAPYLRSVCRAQALSSGIRRHIRGEKRIISLNVDESFDF
jgi:hypothetical protein